MNEILESLKSAYLTQENIAKQFGVNQTAVCRWYKRNEFPFRRVRRAAELLGRDHADLLKHY